MCPDCGTTTVMSVLLCLLFALVEVHSQPVPYISFSGTKLPNNSYVDFNHVWEPNNAHVVCHTDLDTCCSMHQGPDRGDWFFPNGSRLPIPSNHEIIFEYRTNKSVELRRRLNTFKLSGIYCCNIETSATRNDDRESVCAGLYFSGGSVSISLSVQFFVDAELNGESPQFTLTCTSTGGPATTVTWTRDSVNVSGGLTLLHNATTAQYTHTLTVTGRLPGQYKCTVSNNKPSSDTTSFTVQKASAPIDFMAVQEGPTSIQVSWTPPSPLGDTTGYRIYYSGGSNGSVDVCSIFATNHSLTGLKNGTTYTISIVGISEHFFSDPVDYPNAISLRGDVYPQTKGCESCDHTEALVGGVVGLFVGGVLLTAILGAITFVVVLQRMKTKMDAETSPGVARESKGCISTSSNLAYGQVEGVKAAEYEMCDMPSGAAMATQESTYEIVPT